MLDKLDSTVVYSSHCQTIQKVCQGTEKRWTESLCSQNMSELAICEENIKRCCDCIIKKLDGATIQILRFIEAHISADRQELFLDSHAKGISVGLWGSCADIRPVRKSIMFDNMGVQIDVPKQILQHDACFTFRVLRIRNDFLTISAYCPSLANARADKSKYVVGDLIILDILKSPPRAQTLRAKKWTIRDKSSTSLSVQRSAYPSSVVSKVSVKVPEDVMMSETLSVAVWDEKEMAWSESGISDYQYSESTGHIQFNCCIVGTFALVKARAADFPYRKWSMCPTRSLAAKDADFEGMSARFTINTVSADLVIDILGTCVKLVQPNTRYLSDLIGVEMSSGSLVRQLQQRGYNLMPITTKENSKKDYDLAMAVLQQIARCASSFDFEGASDWNSTLGDSQSKQIGMRLRESTAFIGGLDVFNYECVLAEVDAQSQSQLHAPEVGAMGGSGVKFSLVVGDEYKSQTRFSHALRPLEVSHADLKSSMTNRMTAETSARIDQQNVRFEKNVFEFLRLVRPFNCS